MSKQDLEPLAAQLAKQSEVAARLLRVMSNKHRLRVLCGLVGGEKSVGQLNDEIPVSQSVLSQHLAVLRRARLVQTRREAQVIYYSMTPGPAQNVIAVLHDAFCSQGHGEAAGSTCAPPANKTSKKPKRR
jgi:DNA-binding transcriptional ArsR family regulator